MIFSLKWSKRMLLGTARLKQTISLNCLTKKWFVKAEAGLCGGWERFGELPERVGAKWFSAKRLGGRARWWNRWAEEVLTEEEKAKLMPLRNQVQKNDEMRIRQNFEEGIQPHITEAQPTICKILSFFLLLVLLLNKIHNFFSWDYFLFLSPVSNVYHGSIQQTVECACTHPPKGSWKCLPDQCNLPISQSSKICSYQCNDQGGFERNCNTHFKNRSMFLFRSLFYFYVRHH